MKSFIITLLSLATTAYSRNYQYYDLPDNITAFGYYRKVGIPLAEEIRISELETLGNPSTTIARGSFARLSQIPYQAALLTSFSNSNRNGVCGGSLISTSRVLTAAHCWFDGEQQPTSMTVVLGSVKLYNGGTRILTNNVVVHPNWNPRLLRNDIAMVNLPKTVSLSASIALIALPSGNELNEDYTGFTALASGFGRTGDNAVISNSQGLSYVNLRVITNSECMGFFGIVTAGNICTSGVNGRSTCPGDSGGPLVVRSRNNRNILIGITSFVSEESCERGAPAGFTRVTSYMNFIVRHL